MENTEKQYDDRIDLAKACIRTQVRHADSNLTPAQRVWKGRRARWANYNAARSYLRGTNLQAACNQQSWAQAVNSGNERRFLKSEGEGD